jgi:hypothetical protein
MAPQPTTHPRERQRVRGEDAASLRSVKRAVKKRYQLILRIRHPLLNPVDITSELGWAPDRSWKIGDRSMTPKGTELPSTRSDGLWSRAFRCEGEVRVAEKIEEVLEHLLPHKSLFHKLHKMGAETALYLQLPGDANIGDRISWNVLKIFVDLRIALEIETFPEWM